MARRKSTEQDPEQLKVSRHPLLVYFNLGRRYRPPAILLILMGPFFFLPRYVRELNKDIVDPDKMAIIGGVVILVGLGLLFFSMLAKRRSYVLCRPDVLEIHTPFYRVLISYIRIKQVLSVQVSQLFPKDDLKGAGKPLMTPLLGMTAVEMYVTSWPKPKKRLQRYLSTYLFSPRADAFVFIVPNYSILIRQIEAASQRHVEQTRGTAGGYQDPFERLRTYQK
jgi:hypothetical protein